MWTDVFGDNFEFTLHTYDYLGLPPRDYISFDAMAKEMADSRVLAVYIIRHLAIRDC